MSTTFLYVVCITEFYVLKNIKTSNLYGYNHSHPILVPPSTERRPERFPIRLKNPKRSEPNITKVLKIVRL